MSSNLEVLRQRVRSVMPDLEIEGFEINDEGLANDVVIVNEELVFGLATTEKAVEVPDGEKRILDLVRSQVETNIPKPVHSALRMRKRHSCTVRKSHDSIRRSI